MRPALSSWLAGKVPKSLQRPPLTTIIDVQMWVITLVASPSTFKRMVTVHQQLMRLPDTFSGMHFYGGISYRRQQVEIAHLHGDGVLDAYVGTAAARRLIAQRCATVHHADGGPGWISIRLNSNMQTAHLEALLRELSSV